MNIHLENVNLDSTSGPNSFGQKLVKYISKKNFTEFEASDIRLCFIEGRRKKCTKPLVQRLDGIYFNTRQNYKLQNANIKKTYEEADGIIFQSQFSKNLVTSWFGKHDHHTIIHNGADIKKIRSIKPLKNKVLDKFENVWSCASHWRPHKRLPENIRYFLEHSGDNDCLVVAGHIDEKVNNDRIFYTGDLRHESLISLYKRSKNFIHLGRFDNCPNVVVDARASACSIICTDLGGTVEIAGPEAIVIAEDEWDYKALDLYDPPNLDFTKKQKNNWDIDINMKKVAEKYVTMLEGVLEKTCTL
tara:strand:- start:1632 stop:2537 length:906 start_codon:yes stop_codon:yes gene_type:complete